MFYPDAYFCIHSTIITAHYVYQVKDFRICEYLEFAYRNLEIFALVKVACHNNCGIKLELLRRFSLVLVQSFGTVYWSRSTGQEPKKSDAG